MAPSTRSTRRDQPVGKQKEEPLESKSLPPESNKLSTKARGKKLIKTDAKVSFPKMTDTKKNVKGKEAVKSTESSNVASASVTPLPSPLGDGNNVFDMKEIGTQLPPAPNGNKAFDMNNVNAELNNIQVSPPKGLLNMKDLTAELDNILETLPKKVSSQTYTKQFGKQKPSSVPVQKEGVGTSLPPLSKGEREAKLNEITAETLSIQKKSNESGVKAAVLLCKFIQCALWDTGFKYSLLNYQFDAVLAAAGIDVKCLLDIFIKWNDEEKHVRLVSQCEEGRKARWNLCKDSVSFVDTGGLLLADATSLGKTVEGIGAATLRNYIAYIQNAATAAWCPLPTMIITPNDAFLDQWELALGASGVHLYQIKRFSRDGDSSILQGNKYILITRSSLMSEMRHVLKGNGSVLFPPLPRDLMTFLQDKKANGGRADSITRTLGMFSKYIGAKRFRTLIIDECHIFRNLMTYGGIGAVILGILSERTVPMSCTPFINSTQDLAAIMTYIDPMTRSSYKNWWKEVTKENASAAVLEEVKTWRKYYIVRRDKSVLSHGLPKKTESVISIKCYEPELRAYQKYEDSYITTFEGFQSSTDPDLTLGKRDLTDVLLLYMINMRMALIHPLIPKGREFTIRFSPSRRHLEAQVANPLCVCCASTGEKNLIPVPSEICHAASSSSPHYAHEDCLKLLQSVGCPRCEDFKTRACMESSVPHPIYCKNVKISPETSGFKATAKILKIVEWVKSLPADDKAVVYSFFEGSLDLIEGALVEELGINCARLDSDVGPEEQARDLKRFKTSEDCKILLATVQSCGSGLNIEEASHIAFVDRWFDASIHQQAQDRCHNLNQKKEVNVVYFDAITTVDEIMKSINDAMSENASICLADGTVIGAQQRSIRYRDVSGPIYRMLKAVNNERTEFSDKKTGLPVTPCRNILDKFANDIKRNEKQDINYSPPSVLRIPGSGGKSNSGVKQRRVVFAPLPNDAGNQNLMSPDLKPETCTSVQNSFNNLPSSSYVAQYSTPTNHQEAFVQSPYNYGPSTVSLQQMYENQMRAYAYAIQSNYTQPGPSIQEPAYHASGQHVGNSTLTHGHYGYPHDSNAQNRGEYRQQF